MGETSGGAPMQDGSRAQARERARELAREQAHERARADLRRRRALVFGEVLPEGTRDDLPEQPEPRSGGGASASRSPASDADEGGLDDEWWHRQVPPHHG